jgi:hypothetical protein
VNYVKIDVPFAGLGVQPIAFRMSAAPGNPDVLLSTVWVAGDHVFVWVSMKWSKEDLRRQRILAGDKHDL